MNKLFFIIEGIADQVFLIDLMVSHFGRTHEFSYSKKSKVDDKRSFVVTLKNEGSEIQVAFLKASTNGRSIKKVKIDEILTATDRLESKTIFILDADAPDFAETRTSLIQNFQDEGLELSEKDIFLLPNNSDNGCLENLLLEIVSDKAGPIFDCFEAYKNCIHSINEKYTKPDLKTKIYAYSEITTSLGSERARDYTDSEIWDLQHDALTPLVDFLKQHLES